MTSLFPSSRSRRCLGAGVFLLAVAALPAADWSTLVNNPPFGQPAATTSAATGDLEFRGVVQEENSYLINLYNPTTKTSQWVPVNGKMPGLEVKSYDASAEKVQISQAGRALTLPLKQAKVTLLAAAPNPNGAPGATGPNGEGGPDTDRRAEIRDMIRQRLQNGGPEVQAFTRNLPPDAQAMIEEFRRRRAENGGGPQAMPGSQGQIQFQPAQQNQPSPQTQQGDRQGQRRQRGGGQP